MNSSFKNFWQIFLRLQDIKAEYEDNLEYLDKIFVSEHKKNVDSIMDRYEKVIVDNLLPLEKEFVSVFFQAFALAKNDVVKLFELNNLFLQERHFQSRFHNMFDIDTNKVNSWLRKLVFLAITKIAENNLLVATSLYSHIRAHSYLINDSGSREYQVNQLVYEAAKYLKSVFIETIDFGTEVISDYEKIFEIAKNTNCFLTTKLLFMVSTNSKQMIRTADYLVGFRE